MIKSRLLFARTIVPMLLIANAVLLNGCNGNNGPFAPQTRLGAPQLTSENYKWYSVNDSNGAENEVTGINDSDDVVGNYTSKANLSSSGGDCSRGYTTGEHGGACSDCPLPHGTEAVGGINWSGYTAQLQAGGYGHFAEVDYPDAEWQYLYGISDRATSSKATAEVGCLVYFGGSSGDTDGSWGVVNNGGLWSVITKHPNSNSCHYNGNKGRDAVGELLGVDSATGEAVGYYNQYNSSTKGASCLLAPWLDNEGDNTKKITLVGTSVSQWSDIEATGITSQNATSTPTIVGTATTQAITSGIKRQVGWYVTYTGSNSPTVLTYPGSKSTAVMGTAWIGSKPAIVGWYVDGSKATHGFVYDGPATTQWTKIDEPNAAGYTVVSGINSEGDICGWYVDAGGVYKGFVGKWLGGNRQVKHRTSGRTR